VQPDSLHCGDAREVMCGIPDDSVHLVVTSPPYWNLVDYEFEGQIGQSGYEKYLDDLLQVWREVERVLVPNGKLCVNVPIVPVRKKEDSSQHTRVIKNLSCDIETSGIRGTSLVRYSLYIWQKQTTEKMFGSYPYPPNLYEQNTVEFINVLVKPGKPRKLPKAVKEASALTEEEWMDLTRQVWFIMPADIQRNGGHPAPFPEALPARLVMRYSFRAVPGVGFPGDVVLDPFNGSGTTTHVARRLGRRYVGIEGSRKYHEMAVARMRSASTTPFVRTARRGWPTSRKAPEPKRAPVVRAADRVAGVPARRHLPCAPSGPRRPGPVPAPAYSGRDQRRARARGVGRQRSPLAGSQRTWKGAAGRSHVSRWTPIERRTTSEGGLAPSIVRPADSIAEAGSTKYSSSLTARNSASKGPGPRESSLMPQRWKSPSKGTKCRPR
jgi:DNA modification methylase